MNRRDRIYQRTESGRKAWESEASGLPPAYRRILGLIYHPIHSRDIVDRMSPEPERRVRMWLDELESLCFVESSLVVLAEQ